MLQAENLSYGVRTGMGKPTGFRITNVNFRLGQGYLMVLLGKNGSGKTTLLRLLFGLYQPDKGTVLWNGRDFSGAGEMAKSDIRRDIAYVGEEDIFFRQKSIGENAEYFGDFYSDFKFKVFREILEEFGTDTKLLEKTLEELSTGEKKQVQLAFVLARRPRLLILDEPGANLDAVFRVSLMERIQKQIAEDKLSVIISTHILEDVEDTADYVAVMEGGNMDFFGDRDRFFEWMGKEQGIWK